MSFVTKATKEGILQFCSNLCLDHELLKDLFSPFKIRIKDKIPHSSVLIYEKMVVSSKQMIASIIAVRQIEATGKMPLHPSAAFYLFKSIYSTNWKYERGQGIPLTQQLLLKRKYFNYL